SAIAEDEWRRSFPTSHRNQCRDASASYCTSFQRVLPNSKALPLITSCHSLTRTLRVSSEPRVKLLPLYSTISNVAASSSWAAVAFVSNVSKSFRRTQRFSHKKHKNTREKVQSSSCRLGLQASKLKLEL